MSAVLDTSALLAYLWNEPGGDEVAERLTEARVSAVTVSELVAKLIDRGASDEAALATVEQLTLDVADFDEGLAKAAGLLRRATRSAGLSLGDRACLALAQTEGLPAVTADRVWAGLDLGIPIEVIR